MENFETEREFTHLVRIFPCSIFLSNLYSDKWSD